MLRSLFSACSHFLVLQPYLGFGTNTNEIPEAINFRRIAAEAGGPCVRGKSLVRESSTISKKIRDSGDYGGFMEMLETRGASSGSGVTAAGASSGSVVKAARKDPPPIKQPPPVKAPVKAPPAQPDSRTLGFQPDASDASLPPPASGSLGRQLCAFPFCSNRVDNSRYCSDSCKVQCKKMSSKFANNSHPVST